MPITLSTVHFVSLAFALFLIGACGTLLRKSAVQLLMSIELMLNASNILFVAYAKQYASPNGHAFAFIVMAIAAAEAAVGLAIVIGIFRTRETIDIPELDTLRDDA